MAKIRITDPRSGLSVVVNWLAPDPPNDDDLDMIFEEARVQKAQQDKLNAQVDREQTARAGNVAARLPMGDEVDMDSGALLSAAAPPLPAPTPTLSGVAPPAPTPAGLGTPSVTATLAPAPRATPAIRSGQIATPAAPAEEPSVLRKLLTPLLGEWADRQANRIDAPATEGPGTSEQLLNDLMSSLPVAGGMTPRDADRALQTLLFLARNRRVPTPGDIGADTALSARGATAGAVSGAGQMTSPLDVASVALPALRPVAGLVGGGEALARLAPLLDALQAAAGSAEVGEGARELYNTGLSTRPEDLEKYAAALLRIGGGGLMAAAGAHGLKERGALTPTGRPAPESPALGQTAAELAPSEVPGAPAEGTLQALPPSDQVQLPNRLEVSGPEQAAAPPPAEPPGTTPPSGGTPGEPPSPPQTPEEKMGSLLGSLKTSREFQDIHNAIERGRRAEQLRGVTADDSLSLSEKVRRDKEILRGAYEKAGLTPLNDLTPENVEYLSRKIDTHPELGDFERSRARNQLDRLFRIVGGDTDIPIPNQPAEIALFEKIFGGDFAKGVKSATPESLGRLGRLLRATRGGITAIRTWMAGGDISNPLRQAWAYTMAHPIESGGNYRQALRGFASEKAALESMARVEGDSIFELSKASGVKYVGWGKKMPAGFERHENYLNEKISSLPWMRHTERANALYLNEAKRFVFKNGHEQLLASGFDPAKNPEQWKALGEMTQMVTGRGNLGRFEKIAPELGAVFFSPQFQKSLIDQLNPATYVGPWKLASGPRRQLAKMQGKAFITFATFMLAVQQASKLDPEKFEVTLNPFDNDFGKVRIGETRMDFGGGRIQWIRPVFQGLLRAAGMVYDSDEKKFKSAKEAPLQAANNTPLPLLGRRLRSTLAPVPAVAVDLASGPDPLHLQGRNIAGRVVGPGDMALSLAAPMFVQNTVDWLKQEGAVGMIPALVSIGSGAGSTRYETKKAKKERKEQEARDARERDRRDRDRARTMNRINRYLGGSD